MRDYLSISSHALTSLLRSCTPRENVLKVPAISHDSEGDNTLARIPFPFLREESNRHQGAAAFYAIYVSLLQNTIIPTDPSERKNSVSGQVRRLVSAASSLSFGSGVKLSDLEKRPSDWLL